VPVLQRLVQRAAGKDLIQPKSEIRTPKENQSPKSEIGPMVPMPDVSDFGFSSFLRISGFGFELCSVGIPRRAADSTANIRLVCPSTLA
jgi:hypothetical protein